ncbi:MAG: hypothetical protein AAGL49_02160, partial [Pseudomonadota bacterium]
MDSIGANSAMSVIGKAARAGALFVYGAVDGCAKSVLALLILASFGLTLAGAAPGEPALTDVRFGVDGDDTRVVLELSKP